MELTELQQCLSHLDGTAIETLASTLRTRVDSTEGEIAWWRATMAIDAALRRMHRSRTASMAAHRAAVAVVAAADLAGIAEARRDDVTLVARAASEAARALVLAQELPQAADTVLHPWDAVIGAAA